MKEVLSSTPGNKSVIVRVSVLFACSLLGCSLPMQSSSFCKVFIIYFFSESLVFEISLPKFSLQNFWHRTVSAWSSYNKFKEFLCNKSYFLPFFLEHLLERACTFFFLNVNVMSVLRSIYMGQTRQF